MEILSLFHRKGLIDIIYFNIGDLKHLKEILMKLVSISYANIGTQSVKVGTKAEGGYYDLNTRRVACYSLLFYFIDLEIGDL